jgi:hypothetical protein
VRACVRACPARPRRGGGGGAVGGGGGGGAGSKKGGRKGRRAGTVGTRFSTRPSICIVPLGPVENTCIDVSGASTPKSYSRGHSFG